MSTPTPSLTIESYSSFKVLVVIEFLYFIRISLAAGVLYYIIRYTSLSLPGS